MRVRYAERMHVELGRIYCEELIAPARVFASNTRKRYGVKRFTVITDNDERIKYISKL